MSGVLDALATTGFAVSVGYRQNCRTNPLSRAILPTSRTCLATPSCRRVAPYPPRGAPTRAGRRSSSASPLGFSGKGSIMFALPPSLSRIACARRRARRKPPMHHAQCHRHAPRSIACRCAPHRRNLLSWQPRSHAISSSTSWSRRSSRLWMSLSLPFLRAHSQ
jgi:hypothetical protein